MCEPRHSCDGKRECVATEPRLHALYCMPRRVCSKKSSACVDFARRPCTVHALLARGPRSQGLPNGITAVVPHGEGLVFAAQSAWTDARAHSHTLGLATCAL